MEGYEEFERQCIANNIKFKKNVDLKFYSTLKIGGKGSYVIEVVTINQTIEVINLLRKMNLRFMILGNGSNVLFSDEGYQGVLIALAKDVKRIRREGTRIISEAGASLRDVCLFALENSLTGLEFAYGIPGTVGGAVYMNAGAFDGEIKDIVKRVLYLDENSDVKNVDQTSSDFSYRKSSFTNTTKCILEIECELKEGNAELIKKTMDDYMERRMKNQPLEYPSAGSVFKRPQDNYASALIDQCALKGATLGGAMVSIKHAGFLVNYNEASSSDFKNLIEKVQQEVELKTGYKLEVEIKVID